MICVTSQQHVGHFKIKKNKNPQQPCLVWKMLAGRPGVKVAHCTFSVTLILFLNQSAHLNLSEQDEPNM